MYVFWPVIVKIVIVFVTVAYCSSAIKTVGCDGAHFELSCYHEAVYSPLSYLWLSVTEMNCPLTIVFIRSSVCI